jgi:methionine salvage enolase-phosphatase E1
MEKALIVDFYKTAVDGSKLDNILARYAQKDERFYEEGGRLALAALQAGDNGLERDVADMFFSGIKELHQHATAAGLDVLVYSNGHSGFITEAFARQGMPVRFIDPKEVGGKKEASSYEKIAHTLGVEKDNIVYITDAPAEVKAATDAGYTHVVLFNPENPSYKTALAEVEKVKEKPKTDKQ